MLFDQVVDVRLTGECTSARQATDVSAATPCARDRCTPRQLASEKALSHWTQWKWSCCFSLQNGCEQLPTGTARRLDSTSSAVPALFNSADSCRGGVISGLASVATTTIGSDRAGPRTLEAAAVASETDVAGPLPDGAVVGTIGKPLTTTGETLLPANVVKTICRGSGDGAGNQVETGSTVSPSTDGTAVGARDGSVIVGSGRGTMGTG